MKTATPAMKIAGILLLLGLVHADAALAIRIFPSPRIIKPAGEPIALAGNAAVAPAIVPVNPTDTMQVGIDVIQSRLAKLDAKPWRIVSATEAKSERLAIHLVVAGSGAEADEFVASHALGVTTATPGPQGYAITCRKTAAGLAVFVVGSDETGMLYGCVTLAHFITMDSGQRLCLLPHDVRDWPDFKHRMLGSSEPLRHAWNAYDALVVSGRHEEASALAEELDPVFHAHIDWMLWNKINLVDFYVPSVRNAAQKARMARWTDYMRTRGIGLTWCQSAPVGSAAENRRGCVKMGAFEYCWSDDERHQAQAIQRANVIRDLGVRHFSLHMIDADGPDPEHWSQRCDECKRRFGDDRAAADVNIFTSYYDAIRERAPDCRIEFIPVPYKAWPFYEPGMMELSIEWQQGNPEAQAKRQMTEAALAYFKRLDELLPKDAYITLREHGRKPSLAYRAAFGNRPLVIWWWQFPVYGWQTFFHSMGRYTKTWDFDDPRNLVFVTSHDLPATERLITLFNHEYAWNCNAPGAAVLEEAYDYRIGPELLEPTSVAIPFLDAAAAEIYGPSAGSVVAEICKEPLSLMFIARPRVTRVINGESHNLYNDDANLLRDPLPQMRVQADAAARAAAICAKFFAKSPVLDGPAKNDLPAIYRSAVQAKHAAGLQALRWACDRALLAGDVQTARAKAAEGLRLLESRKLELARLEEALAAFPPASMPANSAEHALETFDTQPYAEDFMALAKATDPLKRLLEPSITAEPTTLRLPTPLEAAGGLMSHTTTLAARETATGLDLAFTLREDAESWPAIPTRAHDALLTADAGEQSAYVGLYIRSANSRNVAVFLFDWTGNRLEGRCKLETIAEVATADWDPRWSCHVVRRPKLRAGLDLAWNGSWNLQATKQDRTWSAAVSIPWTTLADAFGEPVDREKLQFVVERYWRSREPFGPGEYGRLGDFEGRWIPWDKTVNGIVKTGE
jgi:hypothetical protein